MAKKTREFHDNESEIISGESKLLSLWNNLQHSVNFDVTVSASGVRRLLEGGAYYLFCPRCGAYSRAALI